MGRIARFQGRIPVVIFSARYLWLRAFAALVPLFCLAAAPASAPPIHEIDPQTVVGLLGIGVMTQSGKALGHVVDVLVDADGRPRAVVIDVGGFLGVGNRKVAVDWAGLRFKPGGESPSVTVDLPSADIKAAPEYDPAKPVKALEPPGGPPEPAEVH
jgi:hypothetical protein